jgi:hypothetical protein
MKKESQMDITLREDYGIIDIANADYSAGDKYLAKIRKEYDKMLDRVLNFNFGKEKGLKRVLNYFKFLS